MVLLTRCLLEPRAALPGSTPFPGIQHCSLSSVERGGRQVAPCLGHFLQGHRRHSMCPQPDFPQLFSFLHSVFIAV